MSTTCIVVIGAISTIIAAFGGAALGAYFAYKTGMKLVQETHKNTIDLMQRQEFNKAAISFQSAFIKEQRLLSYDSFADRTGTNACDIIKNAIDRHEIAMMKFKLFICKTKIDAYEKTWKEYTENIEQYRTSRNIDIPEKKKLAFSRINALLEFAEPKH